MNLSYSIICGRVKFTLATAVWEVANYREAYGLFACSGILFNYDSPLRPERFVAEEASAVRIAAGKQDKLDFGNIDIQ